MSACPCGKATCPKAQGCDHCLCERRPEFAPSEIIGYVGPIYSVCCKCNYRLQIGGPLSTAETATARVKPTLRVTVFGGDGADAEALRRAMDA